MFLLALMAVSNDEVVINPNSTCSIMGEKNENCLNWLDTRLCAFHIFHLLFFFPEWNTSKLVERLFFLRKYYETIPFNLDAVAQLSDLKCEKEN